MKVTDEPLSLTHHKSMDKKFKYLGSVVTKEGGDVKHQISKAMDVKHTLWKPLWGQRHIPTQTKMHIYQTAVTSVLLYGSETWVTTEMQMHQLDAFEMKIAMT